jgi:hypothetical protein
MCDSALTPALAVAGMLIVAAGVRIWLTRKIAAPWLMGDELEYSELAKGFESTGHYLFRGVPFSLPTIYPVLIAPAWRAHSMKTTYEIAKTLNVLMMTASGIPFYLWARRLVPSWYAVMGTALFLLIPSFAFTGMLMTENAAFPAFLLAIFLAALALERPTLIRQVLALAAIALASAARIQAVILLVILPTAIALKVLLALANRGDLRKGRLVLAELRRYWFFLSALVVGLVAYVIYKTAQGVPLRTGLGSYQSTVDVHYSIRDAARWVLYHFGEIAFSVGVLPASAFIVLLALAWRKGFMTREAEQAFLAVAAATSLWVVIQAGTFASHFSLRIEERNMFYVAPVLLLAFIVWLAKGAARPEGPTAVAVLVPAALLLTIPVEGLLNVSITSDTFAFVPLLRISGRLNGGVVEMRTLLGLGALATGLLFALVPRRVAPVLLPLAVAVFLALSSHSVVGTTEGQALAARNEPGVSDPSWVDHRIGRNAHAAFVVTSDFSVDPHPVWQTEFWNRSVRTVYNFGGSDGTSLPSTNTSLDPATGRISVLGGSEVAKKFPHYVVVASNVHLAGRLLARPGRLALYRVSEPLRLADSSTGVYPDGWTGAAAAYNRYVEPRNGGGRINVLVSRAGISGPPAARVKVVVGSLKLVAGVPSIGKISATRTWTVRDGIGRRFSLPAPHAPFRVEVSVGRTFAPAQFGSADTRQLGARVAFQVRSR